MVKKEFRRRWLLKPLKAYEIYYYRAFLKYKSIWNKFKWNCQIRDTIPQQDISHYQVKLPVWGMGYICLSHCLKSFHSTPPPNYRLFAKLLVYPPHHHCKALLLRQHLIMFSNLENLRWWSPRIFHLIPDYRLACTALGSFCVHCKRKRAIINTNQVQILPPIMVLIPMN